MGCPTFGSLKNCYNRFCCFYSDKWEFYYQKQLKGKMKKSLFILVALIFLTSCISAQSAISPAEVAPTVHFPSPASTAIPTMTPAPTQTPQIPVQIGTPFPQPKEIITRDNVQHLTELVTFQNGHIITRYSADHEKLFMADQSGVTICKTKGSEGFKDCESIINHFRFLLSKTKTIHLIREILKSHPVAVFFLP